MMQILNDLATDYTLRTVALGSAALGLTSGMLGSFAVLRRQSLLGDAVSHAALPGIVLAFLLSGAKTPLVLVLGAALTGWGAALLVMLVVKTTRIKPDAALGLVLSTFFGFGLLLMSIAQRSAGAAQAGLERFLFGQAASLVGADLATMAGLGGTVLLLLALFWKELKLLAFDPDYLVALGFPVRRLDIVLTTLLVIAIVIGLQTVGVVLMSAMLVAPAAAARQWTDRLGPMVLLAGLFGAASGLCGAVLSSLVPHLPTGPTIVLCVTALTVVSLLAAPNRGLISAWLRSQKSRRRLQREAVLADLYRLAAQHTRPDRAPHSARVLRAMGTPAGLGRTLGRLEEEGLVRRSADGGWRLTIAGVAAGRRLVADGPTPADREELP
jgi:manganese/zinc/iron transport system permease protein